MSFDLKKKEKNMTLKISFLKTSTTKKCLKILKFVKNNQNLVTKTFLLLEYQK